MPEEMLVLELSHRKIEDPFIVLIARCISPDGSFTPRRFLAKEEGEAIQMALTDDWQFKSECPTSTRNGLGTTQVLLSKILRFTRPLGTIDNSNIEEE